ncbi:hypothetical protein L873DRAFT_1771080 [Choiromyces venosus 120613-1]|uniref:Arrestin-like N-terminal domain-containing protein n=1 Tax=Choiromyces venosus 120613-1 TaxID=1336337 RepID=A0A3N4JH02_9PEZI|nr:hypothetical protein L873DRAFT_1771080 [Choiromyces venosus 120613-1]
MPSSISTHASTLSTLFSNPHFASPFTKPQTTISINGDNALSAYRTQATYTTNSRITGTVEVLSTHGEVRFDEVIITFDGVMKTWLDRMGPAPASSGRTYAEKTFLKLTQPINQAHLPIPRILAKGKTYTFPFEFVIPARLLPSACTHSRSPMESGGEDENEHLHLPPSSGDPILPDAHGALVDDSTPDMLKISYAVNARVIRRRESDNKALLLSSCVRKLRVLPHFEDAPPVHFSAAAAGSGKGEWVFSKEKDLKKSLFKPRFGCIRISAGQPGALRLVDPNGAGYPPGTTLPLSLIYTPTTTTSTSPPPPPPPPPKLTTITTKLCTTTTFSTTPLPHSTGSPGATAAAGSYSTTQTLATRCISATPWRNNTTTLTIPISPPKAAHLLPSFTTCLGARRYLLEVIVGAQGCSGISLKLPLQVSFPAPALPEDDDDDDGGEGVEEFFTPRSIAPPPATGEEEEGQLPPHMRRPANLPPPAGLPAYLFPPVGGGVEDGVVGIPPPVGISPGCG